MVRPSALLASIALLSPLPAAAPPKVDRASLERMSDADRACLERTVGGAPPAFSEELRWHNVDPLAWDGLRGKVVVIQSWCTRRSSTFRHVELARRIADAAGSDELVLLALHTPEGADNAPQFLERRRYDGPTAIDPAGNFCDALGVYKRPVNLIIGRHGFVRYAGLNRDGLRAAIRHLLAEPYDPQNRPASEADEARSPARDAAFPTPSAPVKNSIDRRGRRAPDFYVSEWISARPDAREKVVVIDFWATWCGPCVATIPHLNELADRFRSDAVVIGVSNEPRGNFEQGLRKRNLAVDDFHYALAIDPTERMHDAIGVTGIPTTIVMSSDWIVRWQGHPSSLDLETFGQIVEANRALLASRADAPCHRWANDRR